jgi:hypothetical protein
VGGTGAWRAAARTHMRRCGAAVAEACVPAIGMGLRDLPGLDV